MSGQNLAVGSQDIPHINFVLPIQENLFVDRVDLLMVNIGISGVILDTVLPRNGLDGLDKQVDIFLGDVDVGCDNNALLSALLNVDSEEVKHVG